MIFEFRGSWCRHVFFSSRRRHTRFSRDWSSDVCSSDLKIDYTKLKEQDFSYNVQQKLTRRYIEFLFFQVMDDWYQKHSERYQSIVDITKGLARAGIVPGADTLLATSSLKNVESNLLQIQGKLNGAKILLKEFTNEEVLSAGNNNPEAFLQLIG